jgi:hypothetical protein
MDKAWDVINQIMQDMAELSQYFRRSPDEIIDIKKELGKEG